MYLPPRELNVGQPLAQLLDCQQFAALVVEVGDADPVLLPAGGDSGFQFRGDLVDRRVVPTFPLGSGLELPAPGGVDERRESFNRQQDWRSSGLDRGCGRYTKSVHRFCPRSRCQRRSPRSLVRRMTTSRPTTAVSLLDTAGVAEGARARSARNPT